MIKDAGAGRSFAEIASFYDGLVQRYGHDPRAADYGRPESQQIKFRVLADVAPLEGKRVLDVGCGFADFSTYLRERFGNVRYSGIDLSDQMIAEAKRSHPEADLRRVNLVELGDERYDVVTANGIFYLLGESAKETMQRMVARMFEMAMEAVAFNTLSSWAPDPERDEFYADPVETVAFCRTLTPRLTLRHDYHTRDFTVYLYKR